MKSSFILITLSVVSQASAASGVYFGIETLVGYRSAYEFRNLRLADSTAELQVASEISLTNNLSLSPGLYTLHGEDGFRESSAFFDFRYLLSEETTIGLTTTARDFDDPAFPVQDGFEVGAFFETSLTEKSYLRATAVYDDAADGSYFNLESGYNHAFDKHLAVGIRGGVSYVDDYYARSGWNDAHARLAASYRFDASWSLTPYVGASLALDSAGRDTVYAGINLEYLF